MSQDTQAACRGQEDKANDCLQEPVEGKQLGQHLDFSPVQPVWISALPNSKMIDRR